MATYINEGKVQFQPLDNPLVPTSVIHWVFQDPNEAAAAGTGTSLLVTSLAAIVADSDGPSWIQLSFTSGGDTYEFWQAEIFYIGDWLAANATYTPLPPPF